LYRAAKNRQVYSRQEPDGSGPRVLRAHINSRRSGKIGDDHGFQALARRSLIMTHFFGAARRGILPVVFFLCGIISAYGQQGTPLRLSPDTAVEMTIKNNLSLQSATLGLDIKKRKSELVWNQFIPSAGVTGTLSRDNWASSSSGMLPVPLDSISSGIPSNIYGVTPYSITLPQWHLNGAFSATLDFSFALVEGIKSFRLDYEAGRISLEKAKLQMEQAVRKMYNQILYLESNVVLLNESYSNAQRQASIAEANFKAGLAPRLTWLQAQVAAENIKPSVYDLENNLKNLKGNFAMLLGLSYDTPFELEPVSFSIFEIPVELSELISRASTEKPDILELRANIITLQSQKKALALQQYTPFLRLGWTLTTLFNPALDPFKDSLFSVDNWNKGGNFSVTFGMTFNNLFSLTKEGQQRKDMEANLQIQNIRLAQMVMETELEVFTKLASLEKTRSSAEAQKTAVNLAEQSYRLTEEAYRAGLQDFQAVQSASLALDQARLQLSQVNFNYLNDLIDLEYSIGVPFGTLSGGNAAGNIGSKK
jgi:outer membrane protein TolC